MMQAVEREPLDLEASTLLDDGKNSSSPIHQQREMVITPLGLCYLSLKIV